MNRVNKTKSKGGKVENMRLEEAKRILDEDTNRNRDNQQEDNHLQNRQEKAANRQTIAQANTAANKDQQKCWASSDVSAVDIRRDHGIVYNPLRNSKGAIVTLHPDKLRIGKRSENKLKISPRFNGKVLRCPGHYYVIDAETNDERSVYPHIRLLAYFLRYKLTKSLDSVNLKLGVRVFTYRSLKICFTFFFRTCWYL